MSHQPLSPSDPDYHDTRTRFDSAEAAARYAERKHERGWRNRRELELITRAIADLPRGARVLDLPCGSGRVARYLDDAGFRVEAADASQHMTDLARTIALANGQRQIAFSIRDVFDTAYAPATFDAVICNRLLHHYRSAELRIQALQELRRITRGPIITFYFLRTPLSWLTFDLRNRLSHRTPADRIPVSRRQLDEEAAEAGLRVRRILHVRAPLSPQSYVILEPGKDTLPA
ncbi:MAG: class I SAM-dependent methyltransferase [Gammaproteobacteria bacterium]|nr:class I SAM-dependent methyltransferase [Gammaproteobacteria bacterium]